MFSFRNAVACLLPTLTSSFVIPVDPVPAVLHHAAAANPVSQYPYVVSYRIKDEAAIRFILHQTEGAEDEIPQQITVTVPSSEDGECSTESVTGLTVNGEALVAVEQERAERQRTGIRWGYSESSASSDIESSSSSGFNWALHCVCLTDSPVILTETERCEQTGYLLNLRPNDETGSSPSGFSLSFTQSPKLQLLHLSYLTPPNVDSQRGNADFAHLAHWWSPLLQQVDPSESSISASSLLPTYSTTTEASFFTITTPGIQASPTRHRLSLTTPSSLDASPPQITSKPFVVQALTQTNKHVKPCVVEQVKNVALQVQSSATSALQKVIGSFRAHKDCDKSSRILGASQSRNETRDIPADERIISTESFNGTHFVAQERDDPTIRALHITSLVVVFFGCSACLYAWIRRDPRRRADIAAKREERRNRRLYKRAACKYRWQSFLSRICGADTYQPQSERFSRAQSYETDSRWQEKFYPSESVDVEPRGQSSMREELDGLQSAHRFVQGILHGERRPEIPTKDSTLNRHTRSYSDSLNSEKSMLPAYTEKDELVILDGELRSSRALRELTPASSIIATSPQISDCGSSDSEKE